MARQQRKKARVHGVAARSKSSVSHLNDPVQADALGAAAVAATFGNDAASTVDKEAENEPNALQNYSRGQRKRLKRRAAFMRKMGIVSRVAQDQQLHAKAAEDGVFAEKKQNL
ncbi:hypothetical protein CCR75_007260 [Bremia lactucae]|uniref:Ribosome biogenesis protein SLX9 n=1 Tax=Bremia lactucae TaxID=4779 RepID=A0A976IH01_BRELC|nr:hypothetical protein CCR75_007260 [Bremia lactucae]